MNLDLIDISRGLVEDYIPQSSPVESGQYGDFQITNRGPVSNFTPISDRGIAWVVDHIPEWVDRYGKRAFVLDTDEMDAVVAAAERDGLISTEDYEEAMNEMDAIARQWELT